MSEISNRGSNTPRRKTKNSMTDEWPKSESTELTSRHKTAMIGLFVFIVFILFGVLPPSDGGTHSFRPSNYNQMTISKKSFNPFSASEVPSKDIGIVSIDHIPGSLDIAVVADLDKKSKIQDGKKLLFKSLFRRGKLRRHMDESNKKNRALDHYSVEWSEPETFTTQLNEGGRGFELSELKWFNGGLYTVDDRTGIVFELHNFRGSGLNVMHADAKYIITEGNGESSKGQKNEWVTVKDNVMYIGSIGKEYTDNEGKIVNYNNLWVASISSTGAIHHVDWTDYYERMRVALNCEYPAYLIHEAIEWSAVHRKWFVMPRRVSHDPYDDQLDEQKGSNILLIANEDFTDIDVRHVGVLTPERGFSSFTFVPQSQDTIIIALKSMENDALEAQSSFISIFDIRGNVLMDEVELPGESYKYEGIELLNDWTPRKTPISV